MRRHIESDVCKKMAGMSPCAIRNGMNVTISYEDAVCKEMVGMSRYQTRHNVLPDMKCVQP